MSGLQGHVNHRKCGNCGHGVCYHKKEKVFPERGPSGGWTYRYTDCPTGRGVYR